MFSLKGQIAIVTGASSGIGQGIALGLAAAGADVATIYYTKDDIEKTQQGVEAFGSRFLGVEGDVSDSAQVAEFGQRVQKTLGDINIWVNNAGRLMIKPIINTSDATFADDVLKSDKPVLLDFWAEWCGPCKMIAPILDELSGEYADRVRVAKLNIDHNPQTPPKYGIRGIPTLILFKNGTVEAQKVGAVSRSQLAAFLDSHL